MQGVVHQFNTLSLHTKKERIVGHAHRRFSEIQMRKKLSSMVEVSSKNMSLISMLRANLLNTKDEKHTIGSVKQPQTSTKDDIIKKIQVMHSSFFDPKLQITRFNRKIDRVLSNIESKHHTEQQLKISIQESIISKTIPQSPKKIIKISKISENKKHNLSRKCSTLPSQDFSNYLSQTPLLRKRQSSKQTNTYQFHAATRKIPKKSAIRCQLKYDWEDQLLQNINIIQSTNFKAKNNARVQRDKLSAFLKQQFINEAVTTYFKFQNCQNFSFLKNMVDELMRMKQKQLKIIVFFTYDLNQDGYICEDDIYHFLQKLPYNSSILQDFNIIIEFLRKNKVRSNQTNLPSSLLKKRQKTAFDSLTGQHSIEKVEPKKNNGINRIFGIINGGEQSPKNKIKQLQNKKFQINFDIFSLIFAQKMPILMSEIVLLLTEKLPSSKLQKQESNAPMDSRNSNMFATRSKAWMTCISKTNDLLLQARNQKQTLSQKIP